VKKEQDMEKRETVYNPHQVEEKWYEFWEKKVSFGRTKVRPSLLFQLSFPLPT